MAKQEQGICPVCNSDNIEYVNIECVSGIEITDVGVYYNVYCKNCGASFEEHYDLSFAGHRKIQENKE